MKPWNSPSDGGSDADWDNGSDVAGVDFLRMPGLGVSGKLSPEERDSLDDSVLKLKGSS